MDTCWLENESLPFSHDSLLKGMEGVRPTVQLSSSDEIVVDSWLRSSDVNTDPCGLFFTLISNAAILKADDGERTAGVPLVLWRKLQSASFLL